MSGTSVLEALVALPALLQPQNRQLYLEPTEGEALVFARDFIARRLVAVEAVVAFSKEIGAAGHIPPGGRSTHVTGFGFDDPPGVGWVKSKRQNNVWYPSHKATGRAIVDRIHALPPHPLNGEIDAVAGLIDAIRWDSVAARAAYGGDFPLSPITVGLNQERGIWYSTVYGVCEDRMFVVTPNPFADLSEAVGRHPDMTVPPEIIAGRPAAGWVMLSKAQVDLVYAQAAALRERVI